MTDQQGWNRQSIRLKGQDYTQAGVYFVTLCTQDRVCLFGTIEDGRMRLDAAGEMVARAWCELPERYPTVRSEAFVVMPNHLHAVVILAAAHPVGGSQTATGAPRPRLGDVIGTFKSTSTHAYTRGARDLGWPTARGRLWQRNYYEHVVRDEASHERIRRYILDNPASWMTDPENIGRGRIR